ncbi:large ribosomal subunit protein mL54 [Corythoichthys intestinalis]|uniref:large ribosomal subunit protein mL54 n=1 Tax=Corythoichthys intestinalis TaxID=161448 RepID=UPI0025A687F0|nr:large ribosomal subunit protein mL54 [Corythoichthys intestinalis]XP_061790188.1 large ribosomal subunit protein mL54-like [Nerophis lumbriciformis]
MSCHTLFRVALQTRHIANNASLLTLHRINALNKLQACGYAKKVAVKGKGKGMVKEELKGPEVCKDPVRLTSYAVGVNIYKQREDPKIKPVEDYPEWLFQLNLDGPYKLHELEEESWAYWKRLRKENIWRQNKLRKGKKF